MFPNATASQQESQTVRELHHKKLIELLPLIVTMAVLGIVGVIGNIITIRFYGCKRRKTPTILLIISLATVDMVVCLLFSANIAEMSLNIMYTNHIACKSMHFLGHWFVESSGLILGFISFDRYWTICGTVRRQITKAITKKAVTIIIIVSCLMSLRDFFNFDIVTVKMFEPGNNITIAGHYCTNSDDPDLKLSVIIFHSIDALTFLVILFIIVIAYSNVVWTLCKIKRINISNVHNKNTQHNGRYRHNMETETYPACTQASSHVTSLQPENPSTIAIEDDAETCTSALDTNETLRRKRKNPGRTKIRNSERNVTMLMIAVSVAFFVCAAPYFVIKLGLFSVKRASDLELGLLTQFGLRLGYINSVLNPLIYCLFNPSFRRHTKRILTCSMESGDTLNGVTSATSDWSTSQKI